MFIPKSLCNIFISEDSFILLMDVNWIECKDLHCMNFMNPQIDIL